MGKKLSLSLWTRSLGDTQPDREGPDRQRGLPRP